MYVDVCVRERVCLIMYVLVWVHDGALECVRICL